MSILPPRSRTARSPAQSIGLDMVQEQSADLNPFQRPDYGLDFTFARQIAAAVGLRLGEGVTIAHFDEGWQLDHPYFASYFGSAPPAVQIGSKSYVKGRASHGTSVLGLHIGGLDDVLDLSPLLPGAAIALCNALDTEQTPSTVALAETIELLASSRCGVLLLARDWSSRAPHLPYELRPRVAELLRSATRRGIVVVQAAGNGGLQLDHLVRRDGPFVRGQITMRTDPWVQAEDSIGPAFAVETGSLIVGATTSSLPFQRWTHGFALNPQPKSNFGARVDCSAPGEKLFTASDPVLGGLPSYTSSFGGTSGAAAIVAAAVAAVQSLVMLRTGRPLSAETVRSLFRSAELGTPVVCQHDPIGPVPSLRLILEKVLGTGPYR